MSDPIQEGRFLFPRLKITVPAKQFDKLRKLVEWIEAAPDYVELGDSFWDETYRRMADPVEAAFIVDVGPKMAAAWNCMNVETDPDGRLIAVFEHDDNDCTETRVHVTRGPDKRKKGKKRGK